MSFLIEEIFVQVDRVVNLVLVLPVLETLPLVLGEQVAKGGVTDRHGFVSAHLNDIEGSASALLKRDRSGSNLHKVLDIPRGERVVLDQRLQSVNSLLEEDILPRLSFGASNGTEFTVVIGALIREVSNDLSSTGVSTTHNGIGREGTVVTRVLDHDSEVVLVLDRDSEEA